MKVDTFVEKTFELQGAFNDFFKMCPVSYIYFLGLLLYREALTNHISRDCWGEFTRKINNCRSGRKKSTSRLWEV